MRIEQLKLRLEGGSIALGKTIRRPNTFLMFQPPPELRQQALTISSEIQACCRFRGRPRPVDTIHMTLLALGWYPTIDAAKQCGYDRTLAGMDFEPAELVFDEIMAVPRSGGNQLFLCCSKPNAALFDVRKRLVKRFNAQGQDINPHITVAYGRGQVPRQPIETPIAWTACEPALVFSYQGDGKYEHLWPRAGNDARPRPGRPQPPEQYRLFSEPDCAR